MFAGVEVLKEPSSVEVGWGREVSLMAVGDCASFESAMVPPLSASIDAINTDSEPG